ncbi:HAD family hydrolase [Histomonas meleagridis]|uniref:HAD family hydrolase n=1 Tax=Histomonas meleagridis TaxID=135588 RepID=UPI003559D5AD|nr:HAD family hydrolase [Histomonas meleagridis]KAH0797768.1 HAD family hydrolase [Histomonas meleagridis]
MIIFSFLLIHYVTFDIYGTLLNISTKSQTIKAIARENGLDPELAATTYSNCEGRVVWGEEYADWDQKLKKALFWTDLNMNSDCFEKSYDRIIQTYNEYKPFPEVIDALKEMKRRGYTLVAMSNSVTSLMDFNRKALGDVLDMAVLADESKAFKPNLQFFRYVHQKLDFDHNGHTHIAQGIWADIFPANEMNWTKIWVNRAGEGVSSRFEPYHVVSNLTAALEFLPELENPKSFPWLLVGLCIGAVVIIIVVIVLVVMLRKRKQGYESLNTSALVSRDV